MKNQNIIAPDAMAAVFGASTSVDIQSILDLRLSISKSEQEPNEIEQDIPSIVREIGILKLMNPDDLIVGERIRENHDLSEMTESISRLGQIAPIMARPDNTLVHGYRRAMACKELGIQVLVHVVDTDNPEDLELEEDRCRKSLTPWEMYKVTEKIRQKFESEAWSRKRLGKKLDQAKKKGRVDDLLADYVGISRGSLRKIVTIMRSYEEDRERYANLVKALQRDGRVDRHFKSFGEMNRPIYQGPKVDALLIEPDWQTNVAAAQEAIVKLNAFDLVNDGGILLLPTNISALPGALQIIAKSSARLMACYRGLTPEESVWLLASFGKGASNLDPPLALGLSEACDAGLGEVTKLLGSRFAPAFASISIASESSARS